MEKVSFLLPAQKLLGESLFQLYDIESSQSKVLLNNGYLNKCKYLYAYYCFEFCKVIDLVFFFLDLASKGLALYDLFRPIIVSYYMDHSLSLKSILDKSESYNYIQLVIIQDILAEFVAQKKIHNKR